MIAGYCRYTDLIDGTLDIVDVMDMNYILDVVEENHIRVRKAMERK